MKKGLLALSFGTFGLGITEFVMMAILPYVATDLGISIAVAGRLVSAYAIGVCVGAPLLIFFRKLPLKHILIALMVLFCAGSLTASLSGSYGMLLAARFISGLPHGAYFGTASIVAGKLAQPGKETQAVSIMIAGMTVANLLGVPFGTLLCDLFSWRATFMLTTGLGLLILLCIALRVPHVEGVQDTGIKGQFRFLKKKEPWMLIAATVLGNCAIFCVYSYISPFLTRTAGFPESALTVLMILAGSGMIAGNLLGGRLSGRYQPALVSAGVMFTGSIALILLFFTGYNQIAAIFLTIVCTGCLFAVGSPQQVLLIRYAPGGELLGAACAQVAFNLGNAIGAFLGGLPIERGLPYTYTALIGVPAAAAGGIILVAFFYLCVHKKKNL